MTAKIMRPILYSAIFSPPSSAVRLTANAIGLDLNVKNLNLWKREHLSDDYRKINPQHTVPTFVEDDFILWDSHPIMTYITGKYAENDKLYPKDLKKRTIIDQRLHYESGILFAHLRTITGPLIFKKLRTVLPESDELLKESYKFVDTILDGKKWLAGDSYTLADISTITTINCVTVFTPITDCPNLSAWMKNCEKEIPKFNEIAVPAIEGFHTMIKSLLD